MSNTKIATRILSSFSRSMGTEDKPDYTDCLGQDNIGRWLEEFRKGTISAERVNAVEKLFTSNFSFGILNVVSPEDLLKMAYDRMSDEEHKDLADALDGYVSKLFSPATSVVRFLVYFTTRGDVARNARQRFRNHHDFLHRLRESIGEYESPELTYSHD